MPYTTNVTASDPYNGGCPPGRWIDALLTILNNYTNVSVTDTGTSSGATILSQSNTPPVANNTYWKRVSSDAVTPVPMGEYAPYNGRWVRSDTPPIGTIWPFYGDPTGLFSGNGLGLFTPSPNTPSIAGKWYGWAMCNGNNGTVNMVNTFPLAAEKWDDATNKWVASAPSTGGANTFQATGGSSGILLDNTNLPTLRVREYDSAGTGSSTVIYGGNKYTSTVEGIANPRAGGVVEMQIPDNYPLFRAVPFIQFLGYGN